VDLLYQGISDLHAVGWMWVVLQAIIIRVLLHHRNHVIRHGNFLCSATLTLPKQTRIDNELEAMLRDITIAERAIRWLKEFADSEKTSLN